MKCLHEEFDATVDVGRILSKEDAEPPIRFMADIRIVCRQCGEKFKFIGLPAGVDLNGAAVSIDATEARLAIAPQSQVISCLEGAPIGFSIRNRKDN